MQTPYIDTYTYLNPHLVTGEGHTINVTTYSVLRNPPNIVTQRDSTIEALKKTFGFTDVLFKTPHSVTYPFLVEHKSTQGIHKTILVNYKWATEYYHFLTEVLPNTLFLHKKHPTARIFVRESKFTQDMFSWFGINNFITPRIALMTTQILCPFVECGNPSPEKISIVRSIVESKLTFERTHGILIRRHGTRVLENESDVMDTLRTKYPSLTWVIYDLLSPAETAQLFSKASIIVAPHGAGLTNMLFSQRGISIVEFMPVSEPNLCYWHLSELLGNIYTMIPLKTNSKSLSMYADNYINYLPALA